MKRDRIVQRRPEWLLGIIGMLLGCFIVWITLPALSPFLGKAAVWMTLFDFPLGSLASPESCAEESGTASLPEVFTEKHSVLLDGALSSESANTASGQEPPVRPENAGTVRRITYTAGNSSVYLPIGKGYLKNCTSLDAKTIAQAAAQPPAFSIAADGSPEVLIMHTHATECYQSQPLDWYDPSQSFRTTDCSENVCRVGDAIADALRAVGIGVLHETKLHDYPSYTGAYERSAETVKWYLKQYPTIKVVLDVHRDAIQPDDTTIVAPVAQIDGRSCAQVMIISGADNGSMNMPHYLDNLKFSAALQRTMAETYPNLARPILFDYRKYNQDLTTGSILLEMGGHANSLEEAIACGELVGKSLAKTLLDCKKG